MPSHKLSFLLKFGIFLICFGICASAFAEYYSVSNSPPAPGECYNCCCSQCFYPCYSYKEYIYIRSTAPYRHAHTSTDQMEEYEWVGDP